MTGKGLPFFIHTTTAPGDAEQYVRAVCEKGLPARFYVCGGDGTLNEAVNGAAFCPHAAVGVIPLGSGNDFIRNFDKPALFGDILAQTEGEAVPIDLLSVNERYAVNMVNIGFDCEVVMQVDRFRQYPLIRGPFAYLLAVFVVLSRKNGAAAADTSAGRNFTLRVLSFVHRRKLPFLRRRLLRGAGKLCKRRPFGADAGTKNRASAFSVRTALL